MVPHEHKLLSLLSNNDVTFFIPPYQRNYEWDTDQCSVFLDDVMKTADLNIAGGNVEHFFGTVTYFQTATPFGQPDKLVLIDGQQRITTTMLFLAALKDVIDDKSAEQFIISKYLKNSNAIGDDEHKIKLKQVEADWSAYCCIILDPTNITANDKQSAVYRTYRFFVQRLGKFKQDNQGNLLDLIEQGLAKFSLVTIELQPDKNPWENPQEIFESMNSLGKPLSLADLVRNYLLLGLEADEQEKLYHQYWMPIESTVPKSVSDFIRDFMQYDQCKPYLKASESNYKDLYGEFKKLFPQGKFQVADLLEKLSQLSIYYSWIVQGKSCGNVKIDHQLADIRLVNATTSYSFIMALLAAWQDNRFSDSDIVAMLDALFIYLLRRRISGLSAAENKVLPEMCKCVDDLVNAPDKKLRMFEFLSANENNMRLPNDQEVSRSLLTMNFYNFRLSKFLLCLIEEKLTKSRPDMDDEKLQIEHILPQTLNDNWTKELGSGAEEIHQEVVHTIGNLTLIRHNQELGQKPFSEKLDVYKNHAGLQIAKTKIEDQTCWNKATIQERADWVISYILESVLPIPDSMRKTNNFSAKVSNRLSFNALDLIGEDIAFKEEPSITAHVVSDKEVLYDGKKWSLSGLTRELKAQFGTANASGAYSGAYYWTYNGVRLSDMY